MTEKVLRIVLLLVIVLEVRSGDSSSLVSPATSATVTNSSHLSTGTWMLNYIVHVIPNSFRAIFIVILFGTDTSKFKVINSVIILKLILTYVLTNCSLPRWQLLGPRILSKE